MQGVTKWRYIPTSSADRFRRNVVEMSDMAEARACNVDGTGTRRTSATNRRRDETSWLAVIV